MKRFCFLYSFAEERSNSKPSNSKWRVAVLVAVLCAMALDKTIGENYVTNVINGVVTNVPGQMIVGDTGCSNALIITGGGVLQPGQLSSV